LSVKFFHGFDVVVAGDFA
jgi:hypothetical protein